jgi:hypothetical protein
MKIALCITSLPLTLAFTPQANLVNIANMIALNAEAFSVPSPTKPIFDPLGLYPKDSPEHVAGLIKPLESSAFQDDRDVLDPLRLYWDPLLVSLVIVMSASLPFLRCPALLDSTLPGDRGFDPFNFTSDVNSLMWQQRAEIKHACLAMLTLAGWLTAELLHGPIARALDLPPMLASGNCVPSILNDGLSHAAFPAFWIATIALAAAMEIGESVEDNSASRLDPADLGFDPLGFLRGKSKKQKFFLQEAEIFYEWLGMLAITGFAVQEFFLHSDVVDQMPFELMREMML